jgi:hypothetical protein
VQKIIAMKTFTILIAFLLFAFTSYSQETKTTKGLLLLSVSRADASFDIFFPCTIDSTKSLKDNITSAKGGTPHLVTVDEELAEEDLIPFADSIENEALDAQYGDELKYFLVLPVEVTFSDEKAAKFARKEKDSFLDWPVKFFRRTLFEFYNAKQLTLKHVRVISLDKELALD